MSFFARRKVKKEILKVDMGSELLDKPLTARQILHLFAVTNDCQSLENAALQYSKLENIPEDIRPLFYETTL